MKNIQIVKPPQSKSMKSARVTLAPGEEVGEHVTHEREEIIIVIKGKATLVKDGKKVALEEGQVYFIEEGVKHNVRNETKEELEYVYVVCLLRYP